MLSLLRLGAIGARRDYEDRAARLAGVYGEQVGRNPAGFTYFLSALEYLVGPSYEVVLAGPAEAPDTQGLARALRREYLPPRVLILRPTDRPEPELLRLAPFVREYGDLGGQAAVYVCRDRACRLPTTDLTVALENLNQPVGEPSASQAPTAPGAASQDPMGRGSARP
jgi:uncharacterized protein YyaL (SSP411 family)